MASKNRTLPGRIVEGLASLKLSIFLFFALASTSILGTVIQQDADPRAYIESYGPGVARVLNALNLVDMYHSWWFQVLLALLLVNTLVCSLRRLPAALRLIRGDQFPETGELGQKRNSATWAARGGSETAIEEVLKAVGKVRVNRAGNSVTWFAQRQAWARLGPYVAHTSLVLFFLGGIVGARFGFKGFVNIPEGSAVGSFQLRSGQMKTIPFQVECERFELQSYPDGRPKKYLSSLFVKNADQVLQKKTIAVNDPLIQDGIYFYQSSYGRTGGGASLRVADRSGKVIAENLRIPEKGAARIPGTEFAVELAGTSENFQGFGPGAQLVLVSAGGQVRQERARFMVFQQHPQFDERRGGELVFQLTSLLPGRWYTGLQVAYDPGVPFIWAGSILITLGTLMAFFASHRRIWVRLEDAKLTVAGVAAKNQGSFEEAFAALEKELREKTEDGKGRRHAAG